MLIYNTFKKLLKKVLPKRILGRIKRIHYLRTVKKFKLKNEKDMLIVKKLVRKGDFVIDVGANIGIYTKFLSDFVGPTGKVISIEPIPETYGYLRNNVQKLNLKNVKTINIALSDKKNSVPFIIPNGNAGELCTRARLTNDFEKHTESSIQVDTIKLDELIESSAQKITFIKIDVEGHEYFVLQGARITIRKFNPALLIEVEGEPTEMNSIANKLFSLLNSYSYEPYVFLNNKLSCWYPSVKTYNYFFLQKSHMYLLNDI
jgi:FkbM family methyltransferase